MEAVVQDSYGSPDTLELREIDSASKLEMVGSIGADRVLDRTRDDFTKSGARYDVIVDIPGSHSLADCRRALTPREPTCSSGTTGSERRAVGGWEASAAFTV